MRGTEFDINATKLDKLLSVAALASPNRTAIIDPGRGEVSYGALIELVRQQVNVVLNSASDAGTRWRGAGAAGSGGGSARDP